MDTENFLTKRVLKFVSGESYEVCRLCLAEASEDICLENDVKLDKPYYTGETTYQEMLTSFNVPKESALPFTLCSTCAAQITEAYLFQKLIQHSDKQWTKVIDKINNTLNLSNNLRDNVQTVYLLMEAKESHLFTSQKLATTQTKQQIISNVKTFIKGRQTKRKKQRAKHWNMICEECGNSFHSKYTLAQHMNKHKTFQCKQCDKVYSKPWFLRDHIDRQHKPKKVQCSICASMFGSEKLLKTHEYYDHTPISCKSCLIKMASRKDLRKHSCKEASLNCVRCSKKFKNKNSLRVHMKACGKVDHRRFYCAHCEMNYKTKNALRTHLKVVHGFFSGSDTAYKCDWCDSIFDTASRLKCHIVKHTRERNFHCEVCAGVFVTKAALVYHTRLHTGEKPFKCDMCDEMFLSASRRAEHKKRKHLGPDRQCTECGKKFLTNFCLRKHMSRHSDPQSKLFLGKTENVVTNTISKKKGNFISMYNV